MIRDESFFLHKTFLKVPRNPTATSENLQVLISRVNRQHHFRAFHNKLGQHKFSAFSRKYLLQNKGALFIRGLFIGIPLMYKLCEQNNGLRMVNPEASIPRSGDPRVTRLYVLIAVWVCYQCCFL